MRRPLLHFTLRWMMVAVAVVAVALVTLPGLYSRAMRWRVLYLGQAGRHATQERTARNAMVDEARNLETWSALAAERRRKASGETPGGGEDLPPTGEATWASLARQADGQAAWHAQRIMALRKEVAKYASLRRKWEDAAAFPFLYVEPDPPPR